MSDINLLGMIAYEYFCKMALKTFYHLYLTGEIEELNQVFVKLMVDLFQMDESTGWRKILSFLFLIAPWLALTLEQLTAPFLAYPVRLLVVLFVIDNTPRAYKLIMVSQSDDETLFPKVQDLNTYDKVVFFLSDAIYKLGLSFFFGSVDSQNDITPHSV